jgi:fumarate hydratase class II
MVCCQVMANDVAISLAGGSGNFELNVSRPLIAHAFLQSIRLLADSMRSFEAHCVRGIEADEVRIRELLSRSLMLVTALSPHIGYDRAAEIARRAHVGGGTLRDAAIALKVDAEDFDRWVRPDQMIGNGMATLMGGDPTGNGQDYFEVSEGAMARIGQHH